MKKILIVSAHLAFAFTHAQAATFLAKSPDELNAMIASAKAGDVIEIDGGEWKDVNIDFKGNGTRDKPIVLKARSPEKTVFNGKSTLALSGQWLVADGLRFENGYSSNSHHVVKFTGSAGDCRNCRLTNSVIKNNNPSDKSIRYSWVMIYGNHNTIDHNRFENFAHAGQTMVVVRKGGGPDEHVIEYNHFYKKERGASNGYETIRIGTSEDAYSTSNTVVRSNLFEETDGEIEAVSVKASRVTVDGNTFRNVRGTVTLRHGSDNKVTNNVFLGSDIDGTGGVRVMGAGHQVTNNLFANLRPPKNAAGVINVYCAQDKRTAAFVDPAVNVVVEDNVIVEDDTPAIIPQAGCDKPGQTIVPSNITVRNNVLSGGEAFLSSPPDNWKVADNVLVGNDKSWKEGFGMNDAAASLKYRDGKVLYAEAPGNGKNLAMKKRFAAVAGSLRFAREGRPGAGPQSIELKPLDRSDVGPAWNR